MKKLADGLLYCQALVGKVASVPGELMDMSELNY